MSSRRLALASCLVLGVLGYAWLHEPDASATAAREVRTSDPAPAPRAQEAALAEVPHPRRSARTAPDRDASSSAVDVRVELERRAQLVQLAREALSNRDLTRVEILLAYARADVDLLSPPDALALEHAAACLREADAEVQSAAAAFLRDVYGSVLRKDVRRVCFAAAN